MKKKNLLLIATILFVVASIATPLLGLALLEPSYSNMFLITILFVLSSLGSLAYCDLWIEERRKAKRKSFMRIVVLAIVTMSILSSCGSLRHNGCPVSNRYVGYGK